LSWRAFASRSARRTRWPLVSRFTAISLLADRTGQTDRTLRTLRTFGSRSAVLHLREPRRDIDAELLHPREACGLDCREALDLLRAKLRQHGARLRFDKRMLPPMVRKNFA